MDVSFWSEISNEAKLRKKFDCQVFTVFVQKSVKGVTVSCLALYLEEAMSFGWMEFIYTGWQ